MPCRWEFLEYVFPIWFKQCGPCLIHTCHAMLRPCRSSEGHSTARPSRDAVLCCGLEKNDMVRAWHGRGMASVNQTRPHCANQMGKTHSKPLAARHGRGKGTACYVWIGLYYCQTLMNLELYQQITWNCVHREPSCSIRTDRRTERQTRES